MKRKSRSNGGKAFALNLKRFEIAALIVLGLLFGYPLLTSALSSSSASSSPQVQAIRTEIATLLEQVEKLKAQLKELQRDNNASSTPDVQKPKRICPLVARVLLFGSSGEDVTKLQEFLAEEGYFDRKNVSAYFGTITEAALKKWQAVNGIVSSGSSNTTGWGAMGPRTRELILKRCGLPGQGGWNQGKPFSVPPIFGTTTWPDLHKKGPNSLGNVCPVLAMPPAASCDGKLRLEWKSESGSSLKCLAWKCHSDDDGEDSDDDEDEDADDVDDDSGDDVDDDTATSTNSN